MEPYYSNGRVEIYHGDWIEVLRTLPAESAQCCATSPPYYGLRDYGQTGQLGIERTPQEYVDKIVYGFREVKRVLRSDGTLWLNMGDSYANDTKWGGTTGGKHAAGLHGEPIGRSKRDTGLKSKDLMGMPWMIAFALRTDGWYLRAQCPWIKRNAMPESVTDRPGTATETIFLLSKSEKYFYDAEAVKMPAAGTAHARGNGVNPKAKACGKNSRILQDRAPSHSSDRKNEQSGLRRYAGFNARWDAKEEIRSRQNASFSAAVKDVVPTRGRRNHDWFMDSWEGLLTDDDGDPLAFVVNPAPFAEAHFATFPEKLVKPCILAGTSEKGCCPKCGAPWKRVVEKVGTGRSQKLSSGMATYEGGHSSVHRDGRELGPSYTEITETRTTGWQPSCACNAGDPVPCTVLEPFWGSGTVGEVARMNHCRAIGIELKRDYIDMSLRSRLAQDTLSFEVVS